jgi:hypothetical protein
MLTHNTTGSGDTAGARKLAAEGEGCVRNDESDEHQRQQQSRCGRGVRACMRVCVCVCVCARVCTEFTCFTSTEVHLVSDEH